ncbi:MAG: hypothetical protein ACK481_06845 [Candidatus Melainabacteria bacterium]
MRSYHSDLESQCHYQKQTDLNNLNYHEIRSFHD